MAWIQRQKSVKKKETVETVEDGINYSSHDLEGLQVSHDLNDFEAGKDHILVLKDSDILKDEDDVLICSSLPASTKVSGKYTGYDDEEFKAPGHKVNVLNQYDDEDDKIITKGFRISSNLPKVVEPLENDLKGISCFVEKKIVQDHDTTFKKVKKKGSRRKKELDFSVNLQEMELGSTSNKKLIIGDFVDDDDLQNAIARVRKEKINMGVEFVAKGK